MVYKQYILFVRKLADVRTVMLSFELLILVYLGKHTKHGIMFLDKIFYFILRALFCDYYPVHSPDKLSILCSD